MAQHECMNSSAALAAPPPTSSIRAVRGGSGTGAGHGAAGPPTVVRCTTTADFLAALPFLTGFTAEDSLFIVFFSGSQAGPVARLDLPPEESAEATRSLLEAICQILGESDAGAAGAALAISSGRSFAETRGAPWSSFAKLLKRRFRREGWPLRELAVIAPDGWAGMLGPRAGEQRALSEIAASPIAAEAAAAAPAPRPIERIGELPERDPERAAAIAEHLEALDRRENERRAREAVSAGRPENPLRLHGTARVAEACFTAGEGPPEARLCARLVRAAEDPDQWLVLALTALTRAEFVIGLAEDRELDRIVALPIEADPDTEGSAGWSIEAVLFSLSHETPDPARLRRAIAALGDIAAQAPESRRSGVLALLAWAWWMLGLATVSHRLVEQALALDAEHALAQMVGRLNSCTPPWQLRRVRDAVREGVRDRSIGESEGEAA
jgi:hypothetical protein